MSEKQKGRKSKRFGRHKSYYTAQFTITEQNKIIRLASHVARRRGPGTPLVCRDQKALSLLRQKSTLAMRNAWREAERRGNKGAMTVLRSVAWD